MRIDSIQLFRGPLAEVKSSSGARVESIFVEMRSGDLCGFGEASLGVAPEDCDEWSAGAFACLRDWLAPALVGQAISSGQELQAVLARFQGNHRARSALDVAWWSLNATQQSKPLYLLLGGQTQTLPLGVSVYPMESTDDFLRAIGQAFERGCDHVTLTFRPGWGLEMLRVVRQSFGSEPLAVDCDGLGTLGQQEMFFRLEDFFLKYIEQPLPADDLVGHAMLQESLRTPICLDQSITSPARAEQAADLGCSKMMRIDIARVGGLTPAMSIRETCRQAKIVCGVGGGPHGAVAASAAVALAVSCGMALPEAVCQWAKAAWVLSDNAALVGSPAGKLELRLGDASGLGCSMDVERLAGAAIERATIRA